LSWSVLSDRYFYIAFLDFHDKIISDINKDLYKSNVILFLEVVPWLIKSAVNVYPAEHVFPNVRLTQYPRVPHIMKSVMHALIAALASVPAL